MSRAPGFSQSPDVIVVGAGLIGLATGASLADRGLRVQILGEPRQGEASPAAAGLLAPSVEHVSAGHAFALASRDRYPSWLDWLDERTGVRVPLKSEGVLQVALGEEEARTLRDRIGSAAHTEWLDQSELAALEPSMAHGLGACLYHHDGAVDNVALLSALTRLAGLDPRISLARADVVAVDAPGSAVRLAGREVVSAATIIIAAGAWASRLRGLPRAIPVEPVRGQLISVHTRLSEHAVFGAGIYMVPRDSGHTLFGSTMERVGFDANTTMEGIESLRASSLRLCPDVATREPHDTWAGLRPVTPDLLPIIGPDPDYPSLFYACGHSRNGILMAPLTADCLSAIVVGETPAHDLSAFAVTRFREPASA